MDSKRKLKQNEAQKLSNKKGFCNDNHTSSEGQYTQQVAKRAKSL